MQRRLKIEVRGMVQGVGFRPYIYRLARQHHLGGNIHNSDSGVSIEVQGADFDLSRFLKELPIQAPPLARIVEMASSVVPLEADSEFTITESLRTAHADTLVSPDIATCDACIDEMLDPSNRRYRYPFINCTNCGPRFTIVRSIPYDRKQTSMAHFPLCAACQSEYDDPLDRRFHAQPNACWTCGPKVELHDRSGHVLSGDPLVAAIRLLKQGCILAIKGLGGFHLAVDATQPVAIHELRLRKHRHQKPLAIMVANVASARAYVAVTEEDAILLRSPQRPIVLLPSSLPRPHAFLDALAPEGNHVGVFLPYTPLHHLLFAGGELSALVMTSGNLSEEPIAIDNAEAQARLGDIADFFLLHNRDILLRCDDSVLQTVPGGARFVRRGRGFVPSPVILPKAAPSILAVGGELKNVVCMSRGGYAFPGQHIGDLEYLSAYEFFQESIRTLERVLEVRPTAIAHDMHPGYMATQWARQQRGLPLIAVQHHHAHIASCMAEHHLTGPVIGVALDGSGYGTDGHAWGGEVLVAGLQTFERAAHLAYVPMPGGTQAIHEPWRMAGAWLWHTFGETWRSQAPAPFIAGIPPRKLRMVEQMLNNRVNVPLTSSCGRLFDAVSALVCGRMAVGYEAQAAIALEACAQPWEPVQPYPFTCEEGFPMRIDARPLFHAIVEDLRQHVSAGQISRRFHTTVVHAFAEVVGRVSLRTGIRQVCLSGGSFQNDILSNHLRQMLMTEGFCVFQQTLVPPGDGGLSLGQLVIAAARLQQS